MKPLIYLLIALISLASCTDDAHQSEQGLAVTLQQSGDAIHDVALWAFDAQGILAAEFYFETPQAVAKELISLADGSYTIVAASNIKKAFAHNAVVGKTQLNELLITINEASSSPIHSHYGVSQAILTAGIVTRVNLSLNRSMAQLQFTISNVPVEVVSARLQVLNSSIGYYPAINRLHPQSQAVDLGSIGVENGALTFADMNLMPVVPLNTRAEDTNLSTLMWLTLTYANGGVLSFALEAPALQNGGVYTPNINYSVLRPGAITLISSINGWIEQEAIHGEILNPENEIPIK